VRLPLVVAAVSLLSGCTGLPGTAFNPPRNTYPVAGQQYPPRQSTPLPHETQQSPEQEHQEAERKVQAMTKEQIQSEESICTPGYGLAERGLTIEQIRICGVLTPPLKTVRSIHPGDETWCRSQAAADWIIASMDRMADLYMMNWLESETTRKSGWASAKEFYDGQRVSKVYDVTEGYQKCTSNVPGLCEGKPAPEFSACHATAELRNGQKFSGTFSSGRILALTLGLRRNPERYVDVMFFRPDGTFD
jgi:hypothetical protein